jgi:hypothetical protein
MISLTTSSGGSGAGRVTGAVEGAHLRPFYFYLPLFPIALLPWALSFELWRGKPWTRLFGGVGIPAQDLRVVRFLAVWCLAMLIVFSLISGKQPHYLVPMLPPLILLFGYFMATVRLHVFRNSAVIMLVLFGLGQVIASAIVFHRYDLTSLAAFVAQNRGADWAFAGRYQGELTFLARLEKPFTIVREDNMDEWLRTHPNSYLLTKASRYPDVTRQVAFSQLVERGYLVILRDVSATSK